MQLEHSFTVPVGIDEAWRILLDIERIGPCMPGATIDSIDGDEFTGTVKVKLGPINLTYKGKAGFVEKDEAAHRAVIDARGRDARGNGTAAAKVTARLEDSGDATLVRVDTDLDITGKPAQFGRGVMVDVGNKLIGQFADRLAGILRPEAKPAEVASTGAAPGRPPATAPTVTAPTATAPTAGEQQAAAGAPAEQARPEPARPAAPPNPAASAAEAPTIPMPAERPPAADPVPSVNGHGASSFGRSEVEPISLLSSAGPAMAKRLAPVAVALVIVVAGLRRYHAKRG